MVNLDPTAGNRMMWPRNKNPPDLVFTDRNFETQTPPTLFCDYTALPFRDGVFETVFYDPPHAARNKISRSYQHQNPAAWSYYGWDITDKQLREGIRGASREFLRVAKRVCLKWSDVDHGESWVLGMMREWSPTLKHILKYSKTEHIASYWITLVPKDKKTEDKLYSSSGGQHDWGMLRPVKLSPVEARETIRDGASERSGEGGDIGGSTEHQTGAVADERGVLGLRPIHIQEAGYADERGGVEDGAGEAGAGGKGAGSDRDREGNNTDVSKVNRGGVDSEKQPAKAKRKRRDRKLAGTLDKWSGPQETGPAP